MTKAEILQRLDNIIMACEGTKADLGINLYRSAYKSFQVKGPNAWMDTHQGSSYGSIGNDCNDIRKALLELLIEGGES